MRIRTAYLSGAAIAVLALAAGPASAQLLNLGGDGPLVSIGSGGGGSGGGVDAGVDVNLGFSDGSGGDGLDLDLLGRGGVDATVSADLFGSAGDGADVVVDLDSGDDGGGLDADVIVDLFGSGAGTLADADIGLGDDADVDAAVRLGNVGEDVAKDLFGEGVGGLGDIGGIGGDGPLIELFGGSGGTTTGSIDASPDGGASGGGGIGGDGSSAAGSASDRLDRRLVANARADADVRTDCFSPDDAQIDHLLARNSYDAAVAASWSSAARVSIVPVEICPDARARLAAAVDADANIGFMQSRVASVAAIRAAISPQYGFDDVLAVDKRGDQLTVYVY